MDGNVRRSALRRYRMYLDECGTEDYNCVDDTGGRYLTLVGVIMDLDHVPETTKRLNLIRDRFFASDPDEPVIFHRTDIVKYRGPFGILRDDATRATFADWWLRFLEVTDFTALCIVIDKKAMSRKENWKLRHPYHYAMSVLVEKYAQFLERQDGQGDIMPEARGKRKDDALQASYEEVWAEGTYYVAKGIIQSRMPAHMLKFRRKSDNTTGLQICDTIAKPSQDYVLVQRRALDHCSKYSVRIQEKLALAKFDRGSRDQIWGYGIKFLP